MAKKKLKYKNINTNKSDYYYLSGVKYDNVKNEYTNTFSGEIKKVNYLNTYNDIVGRFNIKDIKDYCLDRFLNKMVSKNTISFCIQSGYYGDEGSIKFNDGIIEQINEFINHINKNLNEKELSELIERVLILEYGFILPELKNRYWDMKNIEVSKIIPTAGMKHINQEIISLYKENVLNYTYNLCCIVESGINHCRLIDGYHRFSTANILNKKYMDYIYPDLSYTI